MTVTLPQSKLDALVSRLRTVEADLAAGPDRDTYVKLSREFSELQPLVETHQGLPRASAPRSPISTPCWPTPRPTPRCARSPRPRSPRSKRGATRWRSRSASRSSPRTRWTSATSSWKSAPAPAATRPRCSPATCSACTSATPRKNGWKVEVVSASEGTVGGYKEIIAEIKGRGAFAKLKFESGVHRVQRVPDTETQGRIHTSAATVAVLPEAEEVDVKINDADLKIDTMRAGGAGGQHVNKTESAIRITHLPTGIAIVVQEERSQHQNRAKAMAALRARLYDAERQKLDSERAAARRGQVGSGDRSERIRTYNFPQARVSDHRINLTLYKLPQIMEGEALGEIIDALVTEHQAELLAAEDA